MKKLTTLAVALPLMIGAMLLPGISSAQSVGSLQAEINSLLAEVQQLEAQLAAQGGSASSCHTFTTNLSIGQSGSEVTALQTALQQDGESVSVTGIFDDQTASAVTGFQQKYASQVLAPNGLQFGTGYVGPATRAELNALFGCSQIVTNRDPIPAPNPIAVTVTSPSVGQSFAYGSTMNIQWTPAAGGVAVIQLVSTTGGESPIIYSNKVFDDPVDYSGSYSYLISPGSIPLGSYYVSVMNPENDQANPPGTAIGQSGVFTIVAATPTPTTSNSSLSIASVSGLQTSYLPGQPISFTLDGVQLPSNVPADNSGFNVQAWLTDNGGISNVAGVNGSYNSNTGLWNVTLIAPSSTGAYNLSVSLYCTSVQCSIGSSQVSQNFNLTVSSTVGPAPTVTLSASPTTITAGQSTTLTWSSTNATYCTASGGAQYWPGTANPSGSVTNQQPTVNTTYTMSCTGPGGTGSASLVVTVNPVSQQSSTSAPLITANYMTPSSGSSAVGATQTFTQTYFDSAGGSDITQAWILINNSGTGNAAGSPRVNACYIRWDKTAGNANGTLVLLNDANTGWSPPYPVGVATPTNFPLLNSQCSFDPGAASVNISGNNFTLALPISFSSSFTGSKDIWVWVNNASINGGWQKMGTWNVTATTGSGGTLTATQNAALGTESVSKGSTNQEIGSYLLTAGSAGGVNVNSVSIAANSNGSFSASNLQNLKLMVNGAQFGTTQPTVAADTYTFSGAPISIPAGGSVAVNVYADILSSASGASSGGATSLTSAIGSGATSNSPISFSSTIAGQNITIAGSASVLVTANQGLNPTAGQVLMGTAGDTLAAFNFQETTDIENVKVTSLNVVDVTNAANPSFNTITLWNGSTEIGGQANYVGATTVNGQSAFLYQFQLGNSSNFVIPRGATIALTLKGNVNALAAGNVTDGSTHTFEVANSGLVAIGQTSNQVANVVVSNAVGGGQTVLQSNAVFSVAQLGASSNRLKSAGDQLATLTFTPGSSGSIALNTLTINLSGNAIASTVAQENAFASKVYLLLNGTQYLGTTSNCTANVGCAVTWNFGSSVSGFQLIGGSPTTFTLVADDFDNTNVASSNNSVGLSATIATNSSIQYTDGISSANSTISNIGLPASVITPIQLFSAQYVQNS